ncbi:MAG: hypothetical protein P4L85_22975 [Paludisphaera borealis]|uniref:hypothetical protein n=1 Tax=Paludisphaera borealis TaxID=1387353 RepID=UPI00285192A7|nr:hypothetical protein [Paludisphaera borealis]MDR3622232.1 hypothetical protein [Paludisphaera borealis]
MASRPGLVGGALPANHGPEFSEQVEYGETVTRIALDFKAPLPDDLFQELVVPGVVVE